MALDKQKISMPIVDGIDTKGDSKTVLPTRFIELENVVFTNPGSLRKRDGYEAISKKVLNTDDVSTGSALTTLGDELLMYSNNRLYSRSDAEDAWSDKGEIRFCSSFSTQVSADAQALIRPSSFTYNNVTCYAYDKRNFTITPDPGFPADPDVYAENTTIQVVLVDNNTNTILSKFEINPENMGSSLINGNYNSPKVGFTGSHFIIFFNSPDHVPSGERGFRFASINYLNPTVFLVSTTKINSTVVTHYDTFSFNNRCFISYWDGTHVQIKYVNQDLSVSTAADTLYNVTPNNICLSNEGSNLRAVISAADGSVAKAYLYNFNLSASVHPATTIPIPTLPAALVDSGDGIYTMGACQSPNLTNESTLYFQIKNWRSKLGCIAKGVINSSGTYTLLDSLVQTGAEIQSKPVTLGSYSYVFVVKNIDPNYSATIDTGGGIEVINKPVRTLYLVKSQNSYTEITAQFDVDSTVVVDSLNVTGIPNVHTDGFVFELPISVINSFQPISATQVLADTVIKKAVADFSQLTNYFDAEQGNSLYISGGLLKQYDGNKVVEFGFLDTPEPIKQIEVADYAAAASGPGLSGAVSLYQYCVVYKWTDRTSKIHRSAPSRAVSLSLAAGTYAVQLYFTPLYLTNKENVEIEVYRTQANSNIFYKLSSVVDASNGGSTDDYITGTYANDPERKFIIVTDTVFDEELQYSEVLYTTGGILENDAPLSSSFVSSYKSRLFLILSDGYTLQYSKITGIGDPVRFNAGQKIPMDAKGGKATCSITMDNHFLIFKERAIFALNGEGPNDSGQQDDYGVPYLITSDAGCIDPNSLVENPNGVMFKSSKGIYLLKRNFSLQYIGDSVEAYNSETVVSSTLLPTVNQIRLITSAGRALVYDYYCNRWTTFKNIYAVDSLDYNGNYYYLKSDGTLLKETPGVYLDNGSFIKIKIKSAWIQISGVQGFQRLYKMLFLGDYISKHKLKVSFAFDFNEFAKQETIIDAGTLSTPVYGEGKYGTGVYGGAFPLYQWEVFPKTQKCQSFQYTLEDIKTEIDGASFSLSHVFAEIGMKSGSNKMVAGRKFGAK